MVRTPHPSVIDRYMCNPVLGQYAMSQKANAEMVATNFEKFAEKAGWDTEELANHLHDEYGSEETEETDLTEGMFEETEETEDTPEETDFEGTHDMDEIPHGKKTQLASKGVEMGLIEEYPGNSHEALDEALSGKVSQIVTGDIEETEETEDNPEETEETGYNVPYGNTDSPNDPSSYDHPEVIMAYDEIKNHENYDGSTPVNKLMHYQGKHNVCPECEVWAAMSGETCNQCRKGSNGSNGSNGDSDKSLMSSLIQNPDNDINTISQAEEEIAKME